MSNVGLDQHGFASITVMRYHKIPVFRRGNKCHKFPYISELRIASIAISSESLIHLINWVSLRHQGVKIDWHRENISTHDVAQLALIVVLCIIFSSRVIKPLTSSTFWFAVLLFAPHFITLHLLPK
jgi:hypothetical protein